MYVVSANRPSVSLVAVHWTTTVVNSIFL